LAPVYAKSKAKDVLPNINRTQTPEIIPGSDGMVASAAACCLRRAHTIRTLLGVTGAGRVGWLEFNVPFHHKYGHIRDEDDGSAKRVFVPSDLDL